jgi:hypothetical protein
MALSYTQEPSGVVRPLGASFCGLGLPLGGVEDMEKRRSGLFLFVAAGVTSLALCSNEAAATQLQLKLTKGKTYYQRTMVVQQTTQDQQQEIEHIGTGTKLQVLDIDAQGNMRIQYTYLWSRFKQFIPMERLDVGAQGNWHAYGWSTLRRPPPEVDYDSSLKSPVPAGAAGFAALVGQSYTVRLTPKGKVLDVNGVEQLREAVLKKLPAGADATMGMNPVAMYIDPASVKQMTEANMAIYPDKSINPGDSWTREMSMTMGFAMIIQSKWTLQKEEAGVATIGLAGAIRTDPKSPPMDAGGMKVKIDLSGTQEGTLQVAEATGLITSAKERQQLKRQVKVAASADAEPMMAMMTIDTQIIGEMGEQMWKTSPQ